MKLRAIKSGKYFFRKCNVQGFTLVELLVVIAIIAILAALLFPVLSRAKGKSQGIQCLNNGQQMIKALHMYAADFNDWLPPNQDEGNQNVWLKGTMESPLDATNTLFLTDPRFAKLAPYTGPSPSMYKCPADKSTVTIVGKTYPRVRTISMSSAIGTKSQTPLTPVDGKWLDGSHRHKANQPWRTYGRFADMVEPAPSGLWVYIDEDDKLLNDGAFAVSMSQPTTMVDWPGTYHNFSAGFAFADGHSEIHKWIDSRTKVPGNYKTDPNNFAQHKYQPGSLDIL